MEGGNRPRRSPGVSRWGRRQRKQNGEPLCLQTPCSADAELSEVSVGAVPGSALQPPGAALGLQCHLAAGRTFLTQSNTEPARADGSWQGLPKGAWCSGGAGAPLPARRPPYLWGFIWAPGDWGNPRLKPRAVQPGPGLSSGSPHSHIPKAGSACAADPAPASGPWPWLRRGSCGLKRSHVTDRWF